MTDQRLLKWSPRLDSFSLQTTEERRATGGPLHWRVNNLIDSGFLHLGDRVMSETGSWLVTPGTSSRIHRWTPHRWKVMSHGDKVSLHAYIRPRREPVFWSGP